MATLSDDFQRADASTLGANWTTTTNTNTGYNIATGAAVPQGTTTHIARRTTTLTADHSSTVRQGNTLGGSFKGPACRMPATLGADATGTGAFYLAVISGTTSTTLSIRRKEPAAGTLTQLASGTLAAALADGDEITIQAVGNVITAFHKPAGASTLVQVCQATDSTGTVPATNGGVGMYTSGSTSTSQRWGAHLAADVAAAPTADTTPPSVPTGLTATVTGSNVALSWTASSDAVGVAGYRVSRDGSVIAPSLTGTSYNDDAVAAGTHSYTVAAFDAAGNVSAASTAASATVSAPPPTTGGTTTTPTGTVTATPGGPWFITDSELGSLPMTGAAWTRVTGIASSAWGTGSLMALDSTFHTAALIGATVWRRKALAGANDTALRQKVINALLSLPGTEDKPGSAPASQPLNPYRQIAPVIEAGVLIDTPVGSTAPSAGLRQLTAANGMTWQAWVASLLTKSFPPGNNANWDTLEKCSRVSGNNWGFFARPSRYAVAQYLGDAAAMTSTENYYRRAMGDLTKPNTFSNASSVAGWQAGGTYPTSIGTINPAVADPKLNGANSEDASRGSAAPPLVGSGILYSHESMDGMLSMAIQLLHNGKADAITLGNNAMRRNVQNATVNGGWPTDSQFWHQGPVFNYLFKSTITAITQPQQDNRPRRHIPGMTDWLTSTGSTWLSAASTDPGTGGGGTTTTTVTPPNAVLTLTLAAQANTLSANASGSTAGSGAITKVTFAWGDGTANTVLTSTPYTALHTYATTGAKTVTVTVLAADGGSDTASASRTIPVPPAPGAPTAVLAATPTRGRAPMTVVFDATGSTGAPGTSNAITRALDFGDGQATANTGVSVSHTYAALADPTQYPASFVAKLTVTDTVTGQTAFDTVNVTLDVPLAQSDSLVLDSFMTADGIRIPIQGAGGSFPLAAPVMLAFNTATGTWPARASGFETHPHIWIGGTVKPAGFADGDYWAGIAS